MKKDTIILQKLRAALKLFLTASQYKTLIDEDFEKLQEFLAEKGLYLSDEGPRPKTSYVSFNEFASTIESIGNKHYEDFKNRYHVSGKVEFSLNKSHFNLELNIYKVGKDWETIYRYNGPFVTRPIFEAIENKFEGLDMIVGIDVPEEKDEK